MIEACRRRVLIAERCHHGRGRGFNSFRAYQPADSITQWGSAFSAFWPTAQDTETMT
jgi:hypothetical protein